MLFFAGTVQLVHMTVTKLLADILTALVTGDIYMLTLLGLWTAFDMVNYRILFRRLATSYGFDGTVLSVFCPTSTTVCSSSIVTQPWFQLQWSMESY